MKRNYDFRSDTVTHPTPEMRKAMAAAEVGDDVYGEDPTVKSLEEKAAKKLNKEAGLFVTSGTMGNLVAVMAACERGDEVIMGTMGHNFLHEAGGVSVLGGIVIHTIPNQDDGKLKLADIRGAMRNPRDYHEPISKMVIVENTQNACGGKTIDREYMQQVGELSRELGLHYHVDGARIFNAAVDLQIEASELVESVDSITFCLSKGLCAPVGSVLCGEKDFIRKCRRIRKLLGGGMRQAGVIAAAGVVALDQMIDRLVEDHRRAKILADGLANIPGIQLTKGSPNTNMVFLKITPESRLDNRTLISELKQLGVLIMSTNEGEIRLVTHNDVDDQAVQSCIQAFEQVMQQ
ncbi:MAG TPA: low-specificity L-threonine aldolase [Chloroflexi bacterium]|nr:low-specificity L-threonine aldolase [Anaerolineaceae bacterium]HHX09570.1 low-specificity L-threonine aldolase [Chloroflexota bacterium]